MSQTIIFGINLSPVLSLNCTAIQLDGFVLKFVSDLSLHLMHFVCNLKTHYSITLCVAEEENFLLASFVFSLRFGFLICESGVRRQKLEFFDNEGVLSDRFETCRVFEKNCASNCSCSRYVAARLNEYL